MNEQRGNVYENKGSLWKTCQRSRNVIENKDSYALEAGMSLKRKEVGGRWAKAGFRCQVPGDSGLGDGGLPAAVGSRATLRYAVPRLAKV